MLVLRECLAMNQFQHRKLATCCLPRSIFIAHHKAILICKFEVAPIYYGVAHDERRADTRLSWDDGVPRSSSRIFLFFLVILMTVNGAVLQRKASPLLDRCSSSFLQKLGVIFSSKLPLWRRAN